jgi:hypothetical protein
VAGVSFGLPAWRALVLAVVVPGVLSSIRCYATVDRRRSVRGSSCGNKSAVMILDQYGHLFADRLDIVADAMDAARAEALAGVYASCTDAEVVQLRS